MVIAKKEGLTDYDGFVESAMRGVEMTGNAGSPPEIVAMCIYQAVKDGKWKMRYHTGKYSGLMLALRRFNPDRAVFALIRRSSLPKKKN